MSLKVYLTLFGLFSVCKSQLMAYTFQEDGFFDENSVKEWVKLDANLPELERLTICTWVKLHFHRLHNTVWSYCALKNSVLVCSSLGINISLLQFFWINVSVFTPKELISVMDEKRIVARIADATVRAKQNGNKTNFKTHTWNLICVTARQQER